jgi:hypothetical protein
VSEAKTKTTASPDAKKHSSRVLTLDLLRGYFLLTMILDHLNYWPNLLGGLNARGQLFVSGAEGFFIISGIVLGIVRGQKILDKPLALASRLLLSRALKLYVTYVLAVLFFTLIGWLFISNPGLKYGIIAPGTSIAELVWKTVSFQYIYGWLDYLRLYVMFLIASPLVIWLLRKKKWWIVLGASIAIWALAPRPLYPDNVWFQPLHWQLLFFGGMVVGFHFESIRGWVLSLSRRVRNVAIGIILFVTALLILLNTFISFGGNLSQAVFDVVVPLRDTLSIPFDKENLPLARLLFAVLTFVSGYYIFIRFEPFIKKYFGWFLLPYGLNSLYVYVVQAFIVFFVHLIVPAGSNDLLINMLLTYTTLVLIWAMIRRQFLFKVIPR